MSQKNVSDAISKNISVSPEIILFLTDHKVSWIIGSLRCQDGDDNEYVKKQ